MSTKQSHSPQPKSRARRLLSIALMASFLLAGTASVSACGGRGTQASAAQVAADMHFTGDRAETQQFIDWNKSITLTSAQAAVRKAALEAIPAPCCSQFTAETCCCECNMKRATHGLAKHLIAERGMNAEAVSATVAKWHRVSHPNGFRGDACASGRCNLSFAQDGCGGMTDGVLVF